MFHRKGHITLKEKVEALRQGEKNRRKLRKKWKYFGFILLFLVVWHLRRFILFIEGLLFLLSFFQYRLTRKTPDAEKSKLQIQSTKKVRTIPLMLLAIYFVVFALIFTVYGCMYYVLHLSLGQFDFMEWLKYSISVFLLFEIVAVQICRLNEREV